MLEAARKFAQRVVLIHLALLLIVIAFLAMGARQLYINARQEQINSAADKQQLLARQTARGIEAYYRSITQNLELILRPDATAEDATRPAEMSSPGLIETGNPGGPGGGPGPGGFGVGPGGPNGPNDRGGPGGPGRQGMGGPGGPNAMGSLLSNPRPNRGGGGPGQRPPIQQIVEARTLPATDATLRLMAMQLRTRVSDLFVVEAKETVDAKTGTSRKTAKINFCYPENQRAIVQKIADRNVEWITGLTDTEVSDFITLDNKEQCHLIGVPARRMEQQPDRTVKAVPCTVLAIVPIAYIKEDFFDSLNSQGQANAALLDSQGTIMIAMEPSLVGLNMHSDLPGGTTSVAERLLASGEGSKTLVTEGSTFHGVPIPARIVAFEQVNKDFETARAETRPAAVKEENSARWVVMIGSPLADTEKLVNGVFKSALGWGVFVAISVTGLFFSSSFFLIRSRIKYERQRSETLTRELAQARDIQLAWLPKEGASPKGLDIAAVNMPASHISGDFYNWFHLPDGRIAVAIGDVTGHGMSAAFLMSTTQLLTRTTLLRVKDPGLCLEEVNRQLCTQKFAGQFVTMILMILDPQQCTIEIAAAGHPAPLVANRSAFRALDIETQLVLGVEPETRYPTQAYVLHPGSTLLLYTDGVVEAESPEGTMFQTQRLLACISKDFPSAKSIVDAVVAEVRGFAGTGELIDDLTLVAVQLLPVPAATSQPKAIATKL